MSDQLKDPAYWQRLRPLLDEALERRGRDRARYLELVCGSDTELRADLDKLILAHDTAPDGFLRPPGESTASERAQN